ERVDHGRACPPSPMLAQERPTSLIEIGKAPFNRAPLAGGEGFEPSLIGPEPIGLPLPHPPMTASTSILPQSSTRYNTESQWSTAQGEPAVTFRRGAAVPAPCAASHRFWPVPRAPASQRSPGLRGLPCQRRGPAASSRPA